MIRSLIAILCVGLGLSSQLYAEPPSWEELMSGPILVRNQFLPLAVCSGLPSCTPTDGIWQLDPAGADLRILRHFLTTWIPPGQTGSYFRGNQGFLTVRGDRVLFQAYPYDVHFDALSWRMVNRLPVGNGVSSGWALQGPWLDQHDVTGTGLDPGVHGIARCVVDILINTHWGGQASCGPINVPGSIWSRTTTDERTLLWARRSPGIIDEATPIAFFDDGSWDGDRVLLSFDPDRKGFWRGTVLNARFHPVEDGGLLPPTFDLDLDALPFRLEPENGSLSVLHYHPASRSLFGVLYRRPYSMTSRSSLLFSVDPETGTAIEFAGVLDDDFPAVTFASFGSPPETHEQIIPIVANLRGSHGGRWRTDLWLYNPSGTATTITVSRFLESDNTATIELAAHASTRIEDVLLDLGGGAQGDGVRHDALLVTSGYRWAEQVMASARIWTRDPVTGGTFGHAVPSVPAPFGYSNHSVDGVPMLSFNFGANSFGAHLDLDMREPGRYRHNLGIVNTSDEEVSIQLAWTYQDSGRSFDFAGPDVEGFRRKTIVVQPRELTVVNIESLFPSEVVEGWAPRLGVFGSRPAILWTSMVDNATGDATFVPFTSFSATHAVQNSEDDFSTLIDYRLAIPAVAHSFGTDGSRWQTDLYGYHDGVYGGLHEVVAAFHPADHGRCDDVAVTDEIAGFLRAALAMPVDRWCQTLGYSHPLLCEWWDVIDHVSTIYPDVVRLFPECEWAWNVKGGLEIMAGSWFSGFSRTYTTRADGGTYGGMLPLYPPGGWPVQHFAGLDVRDDGRINIGFFNGDHDHAITHRVTLYNGDGELVAERHLALEPLASRQREIKRFFRLDDLPEGSYGLTVLPLDDPVTGVQGRSWAYVSVIDNRTNDPTNLW